MRGTFFVLDNVAAAWPGLVRRIAAGGHEVGSHGLSHRRIYDLSPAEFRAETRAAKARLEDLLGTPVQGYRAAEFSITRASWWALEILAEEGFTYDSSVYPFAGSRYGVPDFPLAPTVVETPAGPIREAPMTVLERRGRRYPAVGGGWLRFFPYARPAASREQRGGPAGLAVLPRTSGRRPVGWGVRVPRGAEALLLYSWVHHRFPRSPDRFAGRAVSLRPMLDVLPIAIARCEQRHSTAEQAQTSTPLPGRAKAPAHHQCSAGHVRPFTSPSPRRDVRGKTVWTSPRQRTTRWSTPARRIEVDGDRLCPRMLELRAATEREGVADRCSLCRAISRSTFPEIRRGLAIGSSTRQDALPFLRRWRSGTRNVIAASREEPAAQPLPQVALRPAQLPPCTSTLNSR